MIYYLKSEVKMLPELLNHYEAFDNHQFLRYFAFGRNTMLITKLRSMPAGFIEAQQRLILSSPTDYMEEISSSLTHKNGKTMGVAYLVLDKHHGPGAAAGFLITLQLIRTWMEMSGEPNWLVEKLKEVHSMGNNEARLYVNQFLTGYVSETKYILDVLGTESLLRGFIQYAGSRWKSFQVGACLVISLLLHAEKLGVDEIAFAV